MSQTAQSVTALVPMRHHSERVPDKNFRLFCGKPLYVYILETLKACPEVESIVVDTDSPTIKDGIESEFPDVILIERAAELTGGDIPINEIIAHDLGNLKSQFLLQTHSTNPLLTPQTITAAITQFFGSYPEHDSLFSVTPFRNRLWDAICRPVNHDPDVLLRTQDLEPLFLENSCLYIFEREAFFQRMNRIGEKPQMFEIDAGEAWDIDAELDFKIAELLYSQREADEQLSNFGR